jgi:hypothetical protein
MALISLAEYAARHGLDARSARTKGHRRPVSDGGQNWAKERLALIQAEMDKPAETKEFKEFAGNYEIIDRIEVGQKVYILGFCERAAQPYGTWQGYKRSAGNFDYGHYFNDRDEAKTDMHKRAGEEQRRLDVKKRSDGAR